MAHAPNAAPRLARWAMALSLACLAAYAFNVLAGKAAISLKWTLPRMGDIAEFLVVLACVTFFVVGLIAGEAAEDPLPDGPQPDGPLPSGPLPNGPLLEGPLPKEP